MTEIATIDIAKLIKTFAQLPRATRNKALRPAMRAGASVIKVQAQSNLKSAVKGDSTGVGAKSLAVYNLRQYGGRLRVAISVKRGAINKYKIVKGQPVRVGLYLSVLEYGKKDQPPKSWLRSAARQKEKEAVAAITFEASKRLEAALMEAKK